MIKHVKYFISSEHKLCFLKFRFAGGCRVAVPPPPPPPNESADQRSLLLQYILKERPTIIFLPYKCKAWEERNLKKRYWWKNLKETAREDLFLNNKVILK
jgi:hypothetical protein